MKSVSVALVSALYCVAVNGVEPYNPYILREAKATTPATPAPGKSLIQGGNVEAVQIVVEKSHDGTPLSIRPLDIEDIFMRRLPESTAERLVPTMNKDASLLVPVYKFQGALLGSQQHERETQSRVVDLRNENRVPIRVNYGRSWVLEGFTFAETLEDINPDWWVHVE